MDQSESSSIIAGVARRVLMIAFHFPPCQASSGQQRSLSFSRNLPRYGWQPLILTANPKAYPAVSDDQLQDIPPELPVHRALALDGVRHLGFRGRYLQWAAVPDRWASWLLWAVPAGLGLIHRYRPQVLWSTYPTATAHLIGWVLQQRTGLPWVADFRDPMTEEDLGRGLRWPAEPSLWKARGWIERKTIRNCSRAVFVTPGSLRIYRERYPEFPGERFCLIQNGYDEDAFSAAEQMVGAADPVRSGPLVMVHSGVLYASPDRDPTAFFAALRRLRDAGTISPSLLKVILRASGHDSVYRRQVTQMGLDDLVFLEPPIGYRQALAEMLQADALLLFQGQDSNPAIPAKFYEYLRARKPIFAMVHAAGDTAAAVRESGAGIVVAMDSADAITERLRDFLLAVRVGRSAIAAPEEIQRHSRERKSAELAGLLNELVRSRKELASGLANHSELREDGKMLTSVHRFQSATCWNWNAVTMAYSLRTVAR